MRNTKLAAAAIAVAALGLSLPAVADPATTPKQMPPAATAAAPTNNAPAPPERISPQSSTTGVGKATPNAANANAKEPPETTAALPATMPSPGSFRASKLIGAAVVNDKNQTIGKVDDIVIGQNDKAVFAVISVGGFLGIGAKLVAVPYDELKLAADHKSWTMPGASKKSLEAMPKFQYNGA